MKKLALFGILAVAGAAVSAQAFEFRVRFVERVGTTDTPIVGNNLNVQDGAAHRIRIQFGVFDNAAGAAPAGGFVGWNVGTIVVSGPAANSDDTRTPGRLSPFNFASQAGANGNPPLPGGDPFTALDSVDATLGTQSPIWVCVNEQVPPQPAATVRGLNAFVSVFEITTDPSASATNYAITIGGNLIAATEWRTVGTPQPPDCGDPGTPDDNVPGAVTYAPFPTPPQPITATLALFIPAPGAGMLLGLGGLVALRRRR